MKRNTLFFLTAMIALSSLSVHATKAWIDLTDQYITNATFDGNVNTGWTFTWNSGTCNNRVNAMEFYQSTFDIHQTLTDLAAGHYRLSVNSFFRTQANDAAYKNYLSGSENITGYLYAGTSEQKIASVYSQSFTTNLESGCWSYGNSYSGYIYFPNNMESATAAFEQGYYLNEMEFDYTSGDINVGLKNETLTSGNWCIFDNFKLECYEELISATAITAATPSMSLTLGETVKPTITFTPADVTIRTLSYTSSDELVAKVATDGTITAIATGTAAITATTTDGSNLSTTINVTVTHNDPTASQLIINEIMPSNVDQWISPAYNFDGWVELYNPTDQPAELASTWLSDDKSNLKLWQTPDNMGVVPAHGYRLVWFDSNALYSKNAPFKLDVDGGTLYISDSNGNLITSQDYPAGLERVSYARTTDGGDTWALTSDPTPAKSNASSTFATLQLAAPTVDQPSQMFSGSLSVNVTIPAGCTLRYTTNGSLPTLTNGNTSTSGQFNVSSTACYRFRLFADDHLASRVTTRSYIYRDLDYSLPVVSVVSDSAFLYGDSIGIYVKGVNGRPGNGQSTSCNWNMDWERPVNFSYMTTDGEMVLNQDVNMEMCGGWSRAYTPHSFKLKGDKKLGGDKNLPYPFFSAKPYIRNRTLQIRNGGNDYTCRIKDPILQTILQTSGIDIDVQSYQPVHEFINGTYIGVLNVREPNNKNYVYANYGWDDDEIDQFEISPDSFYVQKCGTDSAYQQILTLSADAANSETYEEIKQLLDIDEYINYMASEFYMGSGDWTRNNVKGFRYHDGGKMRFVVFDTDGSFSHSNDMFTYFMGLENDYQFDVLYPSGDRLTTDNTYVTIFRQLLQNEDFRRKFIDTYCIMGGSVFEATRTSEVIDSLTANVYPAMALTGGSPYSTSNSVKSTLSSRNTTMISGIKSFATFNLSSTTAQAVTLKSDAPGARIEINGVDVPTGYFNGNLFAPVTLKALAPAGYTFQGWSDATTSQTTIFSKGGTWSYYDQGSLDGQSWNATSYSTTGWSSGVAPLGYKMTGVSTTMSYGSDSSNKYPTYYLRKTFNINQTINSSDTFSFNYAVDDGFIVYVNGTEAGRYNMPTGTVTYNTYSTSYAAETPLEGTISVSASLLKKGTNTIAVELHNCSANSSDVYFDAQLTGTLDGSGTSYTYTEPEITLPSGTVSLTACYEEISDAEKEAAAIRPIRVNEVSGSNSVYVNEYAKKSDWVELYNTTSTEQDVEGMYLSDNISETTKYQITKGNTNAVTTIPAHGHLIIWCDKQATTDQAIHASFKIDGDGGLIALTSSDKTWTDTLYYSAHDGNTTVGRYPDGTNDIYTFTTPTIDKRNLLSSYSVKTDQITLDAKGTEISSSNGFRIRYGSDMLILKSEDADYANVYVCTASGQCMMTATANIHGGMAYMDTSTLPSGFYVAYATDGNGNRVNCKFMK